MRREGIAAVAVELEARARGPAVGLVRADDFQQALETGKGRRQIAVEVYQYVVVGRIVQRLCEIETYRAMSMLGLMRSRDLSARLNALCATGW